MKQYNNEIGIISLTSWKARINDVSKTLYSLIKNCPGFHIVLVLSEEEFPQKEKELPENLLVFVENGLIELMWVYKNYKAMKKIFFTIQKYPNIPIISADDDCFYTCNYAQELYDKWINERDAVITYFTNVKWNGPIGQCTLYPPNLFSKMSSDDVRNAENYKTNSDWFFKKFLNKNNIRIIGLHDHYPFKFHTTSNSLNPGQYKEAQYKDCL